MRLMAALREVTQPVRGSEEMSRNPVGRQESNEWWRRGNEGSRTLLGQLRQTTPAMGSGAITIMVHHGGVEHSLLSYRSIRKGKTATSSCCITGYLVVITL